MRAALFITIAVLLSGCVHEYNLGSATGSLMSTRSLGGFSLIYQTESRLAGEAPYESDDFRYLAASQRTDAVAVSVRYSRDVDSASAQRLAMAADELLIGFRHLTGRDDHLELEIILVPSNVQAARSATVVRLPGTPYRFRFFLNTQVAESHPVEYASFVAHEIFHLFYPRRSSSPEARNTIEVAAGVVEVCTQLQAFGVASWRLRPMGTFSDGEGSEYAAPFSAETLSMWLSESRRVFDSSGYYGAASTLWFDISAGSWDISANTSNGERLAGICPIVFEDPPSVMRFLNEIVSGSRTPPVPPQRPREGLVAGSDHR